MNTPTQNTELSKDPATPAPWRLEYRKGDYHIYAANGQAVLRLEAGLIPTRGDSDIIVAAPALLADNQRLREQVAQLTEALRLALKCADDHGGDHFGFGEYVNEARSALSAVERGQK